MADRITCSKCQHVSGDDWRQCGGSCPMVGSPYYDPAAVADTVSYSGFSLGEKRYPDTFVCPHIVAFVLFMAAAVAARRGGANLDHTRECWDFMTEVVGKKLTIHDPLPIDFDWTIASARECAEAMMEYDDA